MEQNFTNRNILSDEEKQQLEDFIDGYLLAKPNASAEEVDDAFWTYRAKLADKSGYVGPFSLEQVKEMLQWPAYMLYYKTISEETKARDKAWTEISQESLKLIYEREDAAKKHSEQSTNTQSVQPDSNSSDPNWRQDISPDWEPDQGI